MDTTIDTSTVLTVSQAADTAGVSTKTIRRWLHSGRLEAGRAGEAYVITTEALRRAQDWTPSMDSTRVLSVTPGRVHSTSTLSSDLLDRLERQAERIGRLEAELGLVRGELLALQAPQTDALKIAPGSPSANGTIETPQQSIESRNGRRWWRFWRAQAT